MNGALARVWEPLDGNRVFVAQLVSNNNLVLVHPMREYDRTMNRWMTFLPCIYGYATTIRRAQGASLDHGCLYFDQQWHHAGRGYGYVGASRFRSREGCFLYGRIRRTDFLPVGEPQEHEVLQRSIESESSDEDDEVHTCKWGNALSGRMRCFDDQGDSESSASEGEAPVCEPVAKQGAMVPGIGFL